MSQNRRRNRSRAKGSGQGNEGQRKGNNTNSRRRPEPKVDPVEFWGEPDQLPEPVASIHGVPDVRALVTSLGRIPIPGQETAAEHWFSLVYERSAVLAGALAAAGDLVGDGPEGPEGSG